MIDVKHIRDAAHRELTHVPNDNILDCIRYTDSLGKKLWIRHVLVPGVTDSEEDLKALGDFIATLKNVRRAEILPYHSFGMFKWETLGFNYTLKDTPSPSEEEIKRAQTLIGTARLMLETGRHPGALKDAVCSPGGATIQGVRALEAGGFRSAVMEAVIAAHEKSAEMK